MFIHRFVVRTGVSALFVFVFAATTFAQSTPDRSGFTFMADLGAGIQNDSALEETGFGLAGLNVGLGGFVTPNLAIMGRISGTRAAYDTDFFELTQTSGVAGPIIQYWPNDAFNLRAGVGLGFWSVDDESETGLGLILGAGVSVFNRGKHNLQVGFEYSPVITESAKVHNFGITFTYQLQ